jgi:uncharacterized damage-inducible protein DinB
MESETVYFELQYDLVLQSRQVLFDYCRTIAKNDLRNENSSFGRGGSIRNLLVHTANTYQFWIMKNALEREVDFTPYDAKNTVDEIESLFGEINEAVHAFIKAYEKAMFKSISVTINGSSGFKTPFELFTHVITHEYHHKGQILSLSRHLGYIPVDTDVIR